MHTASNVPFEVRQRGGAAAPRTWLILALLTVGLVSAATNVYLFEHRELVVVFKQTEPSSSADDSASRAGRCSRLRRVERRPVRPIMDAVLAKNMKVTP